MIRHKSITNFRLTEHAEEQMIRRQISKEEIAHVLEKPGQIEFERKGRNIYQSIIKKGD